MIKNRDSIRPPKKVIPPPSFPWMKLMEPWDQCYVRTKCKTPEEELCEKKRYENAHRMVYELEETGFAQNLPQGINIKQWNKTSTRPYDNYNQLAVWWKERCSSLTPNSSLPRLGDSPPAKRRKIDCEKVSISSEDMIQALNFFGIENWSNEDFYRERWTEVVSYISTLHHTKL